MSTKFEMCTYYYVETAISNEQRYTSSELCTNVVVSVNYVRALRKATVSATVD